MSGKQGIGNVVVPFLAQLGSNLDQLAGRPGVRLAHSAVDLLATLFATELDLARTTAGAAPRADAPDPRLIDANLSSTDLGPAQIAAEHYISTRHLQAVPGAGHHGLRLDPHPPTRALPP